MRKSQTATEYLIIVAVVIVIGLIVLSVLGGIPSIGGGVSEKSARAKIAALPLSITNYAQDSVSTRLQIQNNNLYTIRFTEMWINSKKCSLYPNNATLKQGQRELIYCYGVIGTAENTKFIYQFNMSYVDISTGSEYTLNKNDLNIVGTIGDGSELHTGQTQCWDSSGALIDCNGTGQDADMDGATKRLTSINSFVVKDEYTNLMWTKNVIQSNVNWATAVANCSNLATGGFDDWRLPNNVEMTSILGDGASLSPLTWDLTAKGYWTSTVPALDTNYASLFFVSDGYYYTSYVTVVVALKTATTNKKVVCTRDSEVAMELTDGTGVAKSFQNIGDSTVVDTQTGLVWQKDDTILDDGTWSGSLNYCNALLLGGYDDWRLPTILELQTTIDYSCGAGESSTCWGNYENKGLFSSNNDYPYWSSTTPPGLTGSALYVSMDHGYTTSDIKDDGNNYVRCVRDT